MIVTSSLTNVGESNYRPSSPHKYAYLCSEKLGYKDSIKRVTTLLILFDCLFLFITLFQCTLSFCIKIIMNMIGYWCLYMSVFKNFHLKLMQFFILNQFIDGGYALFYLILILVIRNNFGNHFYNNSPNKIFFTNIEKLNLISSIIMICFKIIFINYYKKIYKLLKWQREHIDKIIELYNNSTINQNLNSLNSPPKILVIPEISKAREIKKLAPLSIYSDKLSDISLNRIRLPSDTSRISKQKSPSTFKGARSSIESFELINTPDFYQIPLNTPSTINIESPIFNKETENEILQKYFISTSDFA